jgi:hypothetical protein
LISLAYPETITELVDFGLMLKPKDSIIPVYALHVVSDDNVDGRSVSSGKKMIDKAVKHAVATNNTLIPLTRFDMNISNGIIYTIKEQNITDIIIGLHSASDQQDLLGPTAERILRSTPETIFIYKSVQPFNTLKRMVIAVTPKAELEPGFVHWFRKLYTIAKESGISVKFFANNETIDELKELHESSKNTVKSEFIPFRNWDDFLVFSGELKPDDLFVIISSRKGQISFSPYLDKLSYYLTNYFKHNSFILVFPKQLEIGVLMHDVQHVDGNLIETIAGQEGVVNKAGNYIKNIFRKKSS